MHRWSRLRPRGTSRRVRVGGAHGFGFFNRRRLQRVNVSRMRQDRVQCLFSDTTVARVGRLFFFWSFTASDTQLTFGCLVSYKNHPRKERLVHSKHTKPGTRPLPGTSPQWLWAATWPSAAPSRPGFRWRTWKGCLGWPDVLVFFALSAKRFGWATHRCSKSTKPGSRGGD